MPQYTFWAIVSSKHADEKLSMNFGPNFCYEFASIFSKYDQMVCNIKYFFYKF